MLIIFKLVQKIKEEGALGFSKVHITLIPKLDKNTLGKDNYRPSQWMQQHYMITFNIYVNVYMCVCVCIIE